MVLINSSTHRTMSSQENMPKSLSYVEEDVAGFTRKKNGKGFKYVDEKGETIHDKNTLKRIKELVIPPAWTDVWISKKANGHIQATGRDKKDRKQYLYHPKWREYSNETKYDSLLKFAEALPKIRRQIEKKLKKRKWTREKTVSLAIKLLDTVYIRVGNEDYKKTNNTYGLTTLRRKHLKKENGNSILEYKAKSGKFHEVKIDDKRLAKMLKQCSDLPGYELFRYRRNGNYINIDSGDVNEYLQEISDINITAKTFRTWGGTVLTIELADEARQIIEQHPQRKLETTLVKLVAKELNNTVAICRKYYIHPKVLQHVIEGKKVKPGRKQKWYSESEIKVMKILNK